MDAFGAYNQSHAPQEASCDAKDPNYENLTASDSNTLAIEQPEQKRPAERDYCLAARATLSFIDTFAPNHHRCATTALDAV